MEAVEEVAAPPVGPSNKDLSPIAKGKRTKRHRTHSPIHFTTKPSTIVAPATHNRIITSSSSSSADESTTTEEEDTARCLILLAQGHFPPKNKTTTHDYHQNRQISEGKLYFQSTPSNASTGKAAGSGCMYTCKTCNRAFSSFQALGGHRASHKKPKNEKKPAMFSDEEDFPWPSSMSSFKNRTSSTSLSLQLNNFTNTAPNFSAIPKSSARSPRIHECSYCGAEFNSGQALGGHMRRHRGGPISPQMNPTPAAASPRNIMSLDLNLPAPEDENQRFAFTAPKPQNSPEERQQTEAEERINVLSTTATTTPALVDCHY